MALTSDPSVSNKNENHFIPTRHWQQTSYLLCDDFLFFGIGDVGCGVSLSRILARGGPDSDLGDALLTLGDNVPSIPPCDLVARAGDDIRLEDFFQPCRVFVIVFSCLSKFYVVEFHQKRWKSCMNPVYWFWMKNTQWTFIPKNQYFIHIVKFRFILVVHFKT